MLEQVCQSFLKLFTSRFDTKYMASSTKRDNCVNPFSRLRGEIDKNKNDRSPSISSVEIAMNPGIFVLSARYGPGCGVKQFALIRSWGNMFFIMICIN